MSGIVLGVVAGLATIQDMGRPGHMHEGVPPGGAIARELLARANECVGNARDAAAIEIFGTLSLVAQGSIVIGTDEGAPHALHDGERFDLAASSFARVRYIAIRGGIAVKRLLGGRGTLLVARFGGLDGRALRRGDRLDARDETIDMPRPLTPFAGDLDSPIRIVPGPDHARFAKGALTTLLTSTFTLSSSSNRTGARLDGPILRRNDTDGGVSAPMVEGAIQVPASGAPIVLGPDHPTTGGYPVIATIVRADLGRFAMRRAGAPITFALHAFSNPL